MNFPHLLHEIRVDCSISSTVNGRWLQYGHATSFGRPLTTMSSTSCHTIRASSSTARILSFRPLRTLNRKKHRPVRSTRRAPIRADAADRCPRPTPGQGQPPISPRPASRARASWRDRRGVTRRPAEPAPAEPLASAPGGSSSTANRPTASGPPAPAPPAPAPPPQPAQPREFSWT